jgi:hypothetical protein
MVDSSPYLIAALQQIAKPPPPPATGGQFGLGLSADVLKQYAQARHNRNQMDAMTNPTTPIGMAMAQGSAIPADMNQIAPNQQINPDGSIGNAQQQFGGLYGLGQKLKGLFNVPG